MKQSNPIFQDTHPDLKQLITKAEDLPVSWINTQEQLESILDEINQCQEVALDTEFIKRNTYFPILALIQINTGKHIYLVDAPKLKLTNLWQVLSNVSVMIWHACGEDLGIFYLLSDLPTLDNIFDTQLALAYLTGQLQMGYQKALETILNVHVDKGESQSDWLIRPLTYEQERYAVDDVRYLLPLYRQLVNLLKDKSDKHSAINSNDLNNHNDANNPIARNWYDLVWEDCQTYAQELYDNQQILDEEQYLSSIDFRHSGLQRAFLKDLLAWREKLAKATNQPRTFILRKQGVRDLLDAMPRSIRELKQKTSIHRSIIDTYGHEIIRIVQQSKKADPSTYPSAAIPPYRSKDKSLQKSFKRVIDQYSEKTDIPANVLMKKKWQSDLFKMVALDKPYQELPHGLQGWRKDWIKSQIVPLLQDNAVHLRYAMGLA